MNYEGGINDYKHRENYYVKGGDRESCVYHQEDKKTRQKGVIV